MGQLCKRPGQLPTDRHMGRVKFRSNLSTIALWHVHGLEQLPPRNDCRGANRLDDYLYLCRAEWRICARRFHGDSIYGSVGNFSAISGQEFFQVNSATITSANTAQLQPGGDFQNGTAVSTLAPALYADVDAGTQNFLFGFANLPTSTFNQTATGVVPSPQTINNGQLLTVSGYLDAFVDPGSIQVQILAPVTVGITTYSNVPVVFFPTAASTNYTLQMSTNLATGPWVTVTNGVPFTAVQITNAASPAFFRLQ